MPTSLSSSAKGLLILHHPRKLLSGIRQRSGWVFACIISTFFFDGLVVRQVLDIPDDEEGNPDDEDR